MHCYLKVGNSVFNKVVKKVKLILPNVNSFFNLPFPRLLRKGFRGTVKKGVTIENNSNMVKKFFLLLPDSKKEWKATWCPKSASQCQSSFLQPPQVNLNIFLFPHFLIQLSSFLT